VSERLLHAWPEACIPAHPSRRALDVRRIHGATSHA